jgi:hypothetical protein
MAARDRAPPPAPPAGEELLERKIAGASISAEGEWQSELVYAMLAREWTSRPSSSNT